jgi:poly-beta-1,6-N-acetyl-D-glucosamine N-deacetylase
MRRIYLMFRNVLSGCLGIALIASGCVRRRKNYVLSNTLITPVYFHNPNKRLFARCIQWLSKNGYHFISTEELIEILHHGRRPPKGAVWLSCDDAFRGLLKSVLPVISERKIPMNVFVPCGVVAGDGLFFWLHPRTTGKDEQKHKRRDAMTLEEVVEMSGQAEITIGSHTVNHRVTAVLGQKDARFEIGESKRALELWTGRRVESFAYPEGLFNGLERGVLEEFGYKLAATTIADFISEATDPYLVPRFNVGDNTPFPEAVCRMVGLWPVARIGRMTRFFDFSNKAAQNASV